MNPNAEHLRQLTNLATYGTVLEVDPTQAQMRLQIGENQTDWTPIPAMAAGSIKVWRCPTVGEQFLVIAPSGDLSNAQATLSLYSNQYPAPSLDPNVLHVELSPQHFISINTQTGAITVKATSLDLDVEEVNISGKLLVQGLIKSFTDVWAKAISFLGHRHAAKPPSSPSDTSGVAQ